MRILFAVAALFVYFTPALAANMGPSAQTLEALHGTAVTDPARFFDGMASRVNVVEPMFYAPLPGAPEEAPVETRLGATVMTPAVLANEPANAPVTSPEQGNTRSSSTTMWIVSGAVVVAAALLLLLLL